MAKETIKKAEIVALQKDRRALMKLLQTLGVMELRKAEAEGWHRETTEQTLAETEQKLALAESAIAILQKTAPAPKAKLGKTDKPRFSKTQTEKMEAHRELWERYCEEIVQWDRALSEHTAEKARICALQEQLRPYLALEVPLGGRKSASTVCLVGSFAQPYEEKQILENIWRAAPLLQAVAVCAAPMETGQTMAAVTGLKQEEEELMQALQKTGFTPCPFTGTQSAGERMDELLQKRIQEEDQAQLCVTRLEALAKQRDAICYLADELAWQAERQKAQKQLLFSKTALYLSGYVPEEKAETLEQTLKKRFEIAIEICDPGPEEDVPVVLKNNAFVRPVESITKMYALPGPKDVDPSGVMAFFYYLFFGMMLSDAGYGLVMVLGTTIALKRKTWEENMKQTLRMFRYCGISTMVWGALFGSWFGDIVQVVGREFFHVQVPSLALWFEPMGDPIHLLLFSFLLGIVHLFAGLMVRFGMLWRRGQKADACLDVIPVMLLVAGAAPLAATIFVPVPALMQNIGKISAAVGAGALLLTSGRNAKHLLAKLGGGLYGLYNTASGYLSDVLSYSRLLALGLATGSIAGVVNMMGVMPGSVAVKAVLLVVVFVVGHSVNLAINLLGAYVHTNRLQFVELFSKFYEGGGRAFDAFSARPGYTKIEEEIQ